MILFLTFSTKVALTDPVKIIKKGEKAPSDGVFYTNDAHAKLISKVKLQAQKCQAEKTFALQKQKISLDSKVASIKIALDVEKAKLKLTANLLKTQKKMLLLTVPKQKTQWWRKPQFVFWTGFVAAFIATGLATWAALEIVEHKK